MPVSPMDSSGFVVVSDLIPDVLLDVRYYSTFNFVAERVDGYAQPLVLLTREAAQALARVNEEALNRGLRRKLFDGYRPQRAVNHFVRWAEDASATQTKAIFYPEVDKRDLFSLGVIAQKSGHSRGSTIDLTLTKSGVPIDMGTCFDLMDDLSHHGAAGVTEAQEQNRALLRSVMCWAGFAPYENEWWHYRLMTEPYPDTYFDFDIE